jgi:thiaminase/transcriptional activator TenA
LTGFVEEIEKFKKLTLAVGASQDQIDDVMGILPNCAAYIDWYFRVAHQGTPEELASAMTPCPWTYASSKFDGLDLAERFGKALVKNYKISKDLAETYYKTFGSDHFREGLEAFKQPISRDADKASEAEIQRRRMNFKIGTDFEYKFWEMPYRHDIEKEQDLASYY